MFNFKFNRPEYPDNKLNESIFEILNNNKLLSLATITPRGNAYINTAFYAFDEKLRLYIVTDPKYNHSMNLNKNSSIAATIFDSHLKFWKDKLQGVQLFGKGYRTPILQLHKGTSCFFDETADIACGNSEITEGKRNREPKTISHSREIIS